MSPSYKHFRVDDSASDRVTAWIDVAGRSVNVLHEEVLDELLEILHSMNAKLNGRPLVFRSAKPKGFIVGADLRRIVAIQTDHEIQAFLQHGQQAFATLEEFEGNTVALIQGACLGGGLEFALACRNRVAVDGPSTVLGMPEAKIGLMPGWGGTQRVIERVGIERGVPMLLECRSVDSKRAFELGLVDNLLSANGVEVGLTLYLNSLRPRHNQVDEKEPTECFREPNWASQTGISAAQRAILQSIGIGLQVSREAGFRAERELFFPLLMDPTVQENLKRFA